MRGKVFSPPTAAPSSGITPAYAGKRKEQLAKLEDDKDHPRLCGEKPYFYDAVTQRVGSPPPMRGKDEDHRTKAVMSGITPAYAGKRI